MDYSDIAYGAFLALEELINRDFDERAESDFSDRLEEVVYEYNLDSDEVEQVKWLYDNQVY